MWKYVPKKLLKWKKERGSCIQWCRYKFQQILLGPSQFKRIAKTSWTNSENTNTTHKLIWKSNSEDVSKWISNLVSKFHNDPTVNEYVIVVLLG